MNEDGEQNPPEEPSLDDLDLPVADEVKEDDGEEVGL